MDDQDAEDGGSYERADVVREETFLLPLSTVLDPTKIFSAFNFSFPPTNRVSGELLLTLKNMSAFFRRVSKRRKAPASIETPSLPRMKTAPSEPELSSNGSSRTEVILDVVIFDIEADAMEEREDEEEGSRKKAPRRSPSQLPRQKDRWDFPSLELQENLLATR